MVITRIKELIKIIYIRIFSRKEEDYRTWIFSSSGNEKFNYNSKYLFEYVLSNYKSIFPIFIINNDIERKKLQEKYGEKHFVETKSIEGIKVVLNSKVWITSAGLPLFFGFDRKNRIIINLWHGIPLKKIGLETMTNVFLSRFIFYILYSRNYTCISTTSSSLRNLMSKSFGVSEEVVKVWGQPRNDILFSTERKVVDEYFAELPPYKFKVLYAPTFREFGETILFPFKDFDVQELDSFLQKEKMVIFIRTHQFDESIFSFKENERVHFLNEDVVEDIMEVISDFDLLITDYSSIYMDYLLLSNPILYLPYDLMEYQTKRGFNFDYNKVTPGPKPETFKDFKNEVRKLIYESDYYKNERIKCNEFFNEIKASSSKAICLNIEKTIKEKVG